MRNFLIMVGMLLGVLTAGHFGWEYVMQTASPLAVFFDVIGFKILMGIGYLLLAGLYMVMNMRLWMVLSFARTWRENETWPPEEYKLFEDDDDDLLGPDEDDEDNLVYSKRQDRRGRCITLGILTTLVSVGILLLAPTGFQFFAALVYLWLLLMVPFRLLTRTKPDFKADAKKSK